MRKVGISQATFYSWRKKYAGLLPTEMRRLKALQDENARLKKLVAELSLDASTIYAKLEWNLVGNVARKFWSG